MFGLETILGAALLAGANALTSAGETQAAAERQERDAARKLAEEGLNVGLSGIETARGIRGSAFQDLMGAYKGMVE